MGDMVNIEDAARIATEKEQVRLAKQAAKREVRAKEADNIMRQKMIIQAADKQAVARIKSEAGFEDLLSDNQALNKLCMDLADLIAGGILGFKCHVFEAEKGERRPMIENDRREVTFVADEKIKSAIFQYVKDKSEFDTRYLWSMRDVERCYEMWLARKGALTDVKPFDWLSGDGLTFRRLPFDFERKEAYVCPTWDRIVGNIETGKQNFTDFVGSIFEPKSYRQQYLWLQGSGGDGKGTLLSCLRKLLGAGNCVGVMENIEDKFWAENLEQARVAVFSDVKNTSLPAHQKLIDITGSDSITIEKKGVSKYEVKNNIKFIFASNYLPSIQNIDRDVRRIVVAAFKRRDPKAQDDFKDPNAFDAAALAEFPEFINMCVKSYRDNYPTHGMLALDADTKALVADVGAETDMNFQMIVDQFFEFEAVEREQGFGGQAKLSYFVKDTRLTAYLEEVKMTRKDMFSLRKWLGVRWGVYCKMTETSKHGKGRYYIGMREKLPDYTFGQFNPYRHAAK